MIENIQREDLNPIEEATAYSFTTADTNYSRGACRKVRKSRSSISNSIRLLQLPKTMQEGLIEGTYSPGHARALLSLINPADRVLLLEKLTNNNLSVRKQKKIAKRA